MQQSRVQPEDFLVQFFNMSIDLLCVAGLDDGQFKKVSPAWTAILGWDAEDLLGKPFIEFVHPDDRERTLTEVACLNQGKRTLQFENRYRHVDGSYRRLQWSAQPVSNERRIYAIARDVSRRRQLEHELLEVIENERARMARDMHDGLCQTLAGVAALSATLSKKLAAADNVPATAQAQEIGKLLHGAIGDARDMARGLDPIGLSATGLDSALETLASNVQRLFGVSCRAAFSGVQRELQKDVELHLFRIVQEAVNNAIKHGHAKNIVISLDIDRHQGTLNIRDDGVGFRGSLSESSGLGLHTMAYRARLVGGSIEVHARESGGTAVTCIFLLPDELRCGNNG